VTVKGACDGGTNGYLTVENDSGQDADLEGISSAVNISNQNFTATPVDLTGGNNGGGRLYGATAQRRCRLGPVRRYGHAWRHRHQLLLQRERDRELISSRLGRRASLRRD
jgi:hypothetical protein